MHEEERKNIEIVFREFFSFTVDVLWEAIYECTEDAILSERIIDKYSSLLQKKEFKKD